MSKVKRALLLLTAALCLAAGVLAVAAALWHVQRLRSQPAPVASSTAALAHNPLEALYAACIRDMISSTCKVMGTSALSLSASAAKPGELVFIAGVGAIAATDYQQMYEAGDAMCSVVRQACAQDWNASRCTTARKLLMPPGAG